MAAASPLLCDLASSRPAPSLPVAAVRPWYEVLLEWTIRHWSWRSSGQGRPRGCPAPRPADFRPAGACPQPTGPWGEVWPAGAGASPSHSPGDLA